MRGFNLFSKPLLLSRRRGLTRKIAETVDFSLFWYRGTRDEFFIAAALEKQGNWVRGSGADTVQVQIPSGGRYRPRADTVEEQIPFGCRCRPRADTVRGQMSSIHL
jgi:hypothetical protein